MKLPKAIYCKTKEESRRIREIMHEQGLTWCDGTSYINESHPAVATSEVVFYPSEGEWNHALDYEGDKAIPAAEVISQYSKQDWQPKNGDTVFISDDKQDWSKGYYIGKDSDGYHVIEKEKSPNVYDYECGIYVKPYNQPAEQVKELMKKLGVTKNDL